MSDYPALISREELELVGQVVDTARAIVDCDTGGQYPTYNREIVDRVRAAISRLDMYRETR
jgi:hypothetical protein